MPTCHRHYPGRLNGACSLVSLHPQRPSLCNSQVGSCHCCFGACSAFTHVMACTLAESPRDPLHRRLRQLRCLRCRFDCYRVERTSSRAGVSPAEVQRLFTAHCYNSNCNFFRAGGELTTARAWRGQCRPTSGREPYRVISNITPVPRPPCEVVPKILPAASSATAPMGNAPSSPPVKSCRSL